LCCEIVAVPFPTGSGETLPEDADRALSGGSTTDGIGATVPREWGPGTRPEGSHHGAWGRPFHRESAAPGVVDTPRERGNSISDSTEGTFCENHVCLPEIPKSVAIC
jgi:hypothetical protein